MEEFLFSTLLLTVITKSELYETLKGSIVNRCGLGVTSGGGARSSGAEIIPEFKTLIRRLAPGSKSLC